MSDIFANTAAQRPFFRWRVSINSPTPNSPTPNSLLAKLALAPDDPFSAEATTTNRLKINLAVPVFGDGGWNAPDTPPRVGDVVTVLSGPSCAGLKFAVVKIAPLITNVYQMEARQC